MHRLTLTLDDDAMRAGLREQDDPVGVMRDFGEVVAYNPDAPPIPPIAANETAGPDGTVQPIVVFRVAAPSLREAGKLIDVWLRDGEDDDRLVSYEIAGFGRFPEDAASC